MAPFILHYHDFYLPTFFFMVMVASMVTTFYIFWRAGKLGFSQIAILDIALIGTCLGIVGARFFHIFFEAPAYYWADPIRVFYIWQGGFVGYGAFIGVTVAALAYLKVRKLPILAYADLIALGCPLIIFFVRIGCLGAGCCYGKPTHFFIHLIFTNPASDAGHDFAGVALHATQAYDMLSASLIFIFINWYYTRRKFHGQIMLLFFMLYALNRFFIEYLRGDADRGVYLNGLLSTSQITGLVIWLVCGIAYFVWRKRYPFKPHA